MGEEFTFQNVRLVVQAIANYLKSKFAGKKISVIANYDTRFLSEDMLKKPLRFFPKTRFMSLWLRGMPPPKRSLTRS